MPTTETSGGKRTAADVMTPSPRTCSTFSSVLEAVMIFRDADCGVVPVLRDGKPVGVVTDRDVALALADHPDGLVALPVSDIMTERVVSVRPDDSLDTVLKTFASEGVRRLLVVGSRDQLVGIIAWADIAPHVGDRAMGETVTELTEPGS